MKRRDFLQGAASAAAMPLAARFTDDQKKIIAIQLDSIGPVDEGIERVLDEVQQRASVNTLMIDALWFSPEVTAQELAKSDARGHTRDPNSKLIGGRMGFVHTQFYKDTGLDLKSLAPSPGAPDILAELSAAAKKRGIRVIPIIKDSLPEEAPGIEKLREYDFNGQQGETSCKNNPYYRNLLAGVMEDLIRSYDVDGIMYMAERQGAFTDTLGLRFRGVRRGSPGQRTCFCQYCQEKAKQQGISFDRAKKGFEELEKFVAAGRAGKRPIDGYYTTVWRLMLRYPELLAWEHLWHENLREVYQLLNRTIKATRPSVLYGMHIWPNATMSPILRAENDFADLGQYHDFIKVAIYSNCGGPRIGGLIDSVSQTMFGDLPPEEILQFHYRVLNYDEAPLDRVRQTGLKNDFVYRESKRAVDGARGAKTLILPGIDVDIPVWQLDMGKTPLSEAARTTRQDVKKVVMQAFQAGAPGIVISREYTEMKLENLSGAGDAIRELRLKT
ncbi:MAG TPA: hypothetical protein VG324_01665 [Blastocatellia bacterium]|nr:hypothetical protein [Blastocatellia bacterium]